MPGDDQPRRPLTTQVNEWLLWRATLWALQQRRPHWTPASIGAGVTNRVSGPGSEGDLSSA